MTELSHIFPKPIACRTCYHCGGNGLQQGAPVNRSSVERFVGARLSCILFRMTHHLKTDFAVHARW